MPCALDGYWRLNEFSGFKQSRLIGNWLVFDAVNLHCFSRLLGANLFRSQQVLGLSCLRLNEGLTGDPRLGYERGMLLIWSLVNFVHDFCSSWLPYTCWSLSIRGGRTSFLFSSFSMVHLIASFIASLSLVSTTRLINIRYDTFHSAVPPERKGSKEAAFRFTDVWRVTHSGIVFWIVVKRLYTLGANVTIPYEMGMIHQC
jgi:hypothetical protein